MKKIKVGYFADGPWSHKAFAKLIGDNTIEIKFIVPRTDTKDNTLKHFSGKYGIDYFSHKNINSEEFIEKVRKYQCDLFISLSFNQIFKTELINLPPLKSINVHCGKLPYYRGRNILNWALINDEKEFGITVHFIDEGIDTGDIILQYLLPINDEDNYATLLERAYNGCSEILYQAVKQLQSGMQKVIKQSAIHPTGFYCGGRGEGDEIINWNQNSRELFCFIRAICYPGPKATTYVNNHLVKINKSNLILNAINYKGIPGQILGKTPNGFLVKTADNFIEILEIETSMKLKIGDRFK